MHSVSGRWKLGLLLALATAGFWATLPIALKVAVQEVDVITLTWFRFSFAALGLGLWLQLRGGFARFAELGRRQWGWLSLAALMLIGNYVFYLLGLDYTTPANAQLIIQLAPLLMAIGGIFVFKERFSLGQWLGLALVALGMWWFFSDQLDQVGGARYTFGVWMIVVAALVWAIYALIQKQLLLYLSSPLILCFIYAVAAVGLLPFASPAALLRLDQGQWLALLYCALNTLAAYGAFAEALAHWEASRVSVVLALTPLLTLLSMELAQWWLPGLVAPESLGWLGVLGALSVVLGSAITSLLGRRRAG
ncbi:DMT family transporter [Pseudoxanthomonas sp. CAU 1598]|uniref:DMT family transporter n=1 Tax=Pseudomarimonas arenosa TaxID=2774145 RepID=A0AAW3ZL40_9GAMM|nr:DMT family transporter [Pseudomarimonas arenosa]